MGLIVILCTFAENVAEKTNEISEKPTRKTLPDLDRYWKAVNDDPSDFTAWTYLLQYVEQEVMVLQFNLRSIVANLWQL